MRSYTVPCANCDSLVEVRSNHKYAADDQVPDTLCRECEEPERKILTERIFPPIPDRSFDWSAVLEGYDAGDPIGYGRTEAEAIADLKEQMEGE